MGQFYTRRNDEKDDNKKTVATEEFVNLITSMKHTTDQQKEPPKTETKK